MGYIKLTIFKDLDIWHIVCDDEIFVNEWECSILGDRVNRYIIWQV